MPLDPMTEPLALGRDALRDGTVSLWGYGVAITVARGHLVLVDGIGDERRTLRLSKADRPKRITVIVESGGYVSLDAIHWLTTTGTSSLVLLSRDGSVLGAIGPRRLDDAKLRRAQALAPWSGADVEIARHVFASKVAGQGHVLASRSRGHPDFTPVADRLHESASLIAQAASIDDMLEIESVAASAYFAAVAPMPVTFARSSLDRVPERWKTFGPRSSPLTRGNRRAVTLANALLNFTYALLEAEVTIALAAVGLDPGLGVIHADTDDRSSFALDVLEALRPEADSFVLDTIARRSFSHKDAVELVAGDVRLAPGLALEVARSTTFARATAFAVSRIVNILEVSNLPKRRALRAPNRVVLKSATMTPRKSLGRNALASTALALETHPVLSSATSVRAAGPRPRRSAKLRISVATKAPKVGVGVRRTCRLCGVTIARRKPPFVCDTCRPEHDAETLASMTSRIIAAGRAAIERANLSGHAPHHSKAAVAKKRVSAARSARAKYAWTDDGSLDGIDFARDVLPRISSIPVLRIARALSVSRSWAALMRSGRRPTHKRHWIALIALADDEESCSQAFQ